MYTVGMTAVLYAVGVYLACGLLAVAPIHGWVLNAIDPGVRGSGILFRILITPGIVACWPLLLYRWRECSRSESDRDRWRGRLRPLALRSYHRWLIRLLAIAVPVLCGLGLLARAAAEAARHVR